MTVKELRQALAGVPGGTEVEMADGMPVTFAQMVEGVFVISDPEEDDEEDEEETL